MSSITEITARAKYFQNQLDNLRKSGMLSRAEHSRYVKEVEEDFNLRHCKRVLGSKRSEMKSVQVSAEYVHRLLEAQSYRCAITGHPLVFPKSLAPNREPKPNDPSLDRIDNSKGYEQGNVRWVVLSKNLEKNRWTDEEVFTTT